MLLYYKISNEDLKNHETYGHITFITWAQICPIKNIIKQNL